MDVIEHEDNSSALFVLSQNFWLIFKNGPLDMANDDETSDFVNVLACEMSLLWKVSFSSK